MTHFFDYTIVESTIQFEFRIVGISRIKCVLTRAVIEWAGKFFFYKTGREWWPLCRLCENFLNYGIIVLDDELIVEHFGLHCLLGSVLL